MHYETEKTGSIFIQDLDRIDVSIFDEHTGINGESWHVDLKISGQLDENGFVYDFSPLKKKIKNLLKESVDHALLVPADSESIGVSPGDTRDFWSLLTDDGFKWTYEAPKGSVVSIPGESVTAWTVGKFLTSEMQRTFSQEIGSFEITLRPEESHETEAMFRYTHGITNHRGLCQRLFHGHRSKIKVFVNDERRPDLEHKAVQEILGESLHIATPNQIETHTVDMHHLPEKGMLGTSNTPVPLNYSGSFGSYFGKVPANRLIVIDHETSIENFTAWLTQKIKSEFQIPGKVRARVFEGIGKGAEAEA